MNVQKQSHWLAAVFSFLCLAIPIAVALIYHLYTLKIEMQEKSLDQSFQRLALRADAMARELVEPFDRLRRDISLIATHRAWIPMVNAQTGPRKLFQVFAGSNIEVILEWFAKERPDYLQLRYLDKGARQICDGQAARARVSQ